MTLGVALVPSPGRNEMAPISRIPRDVLLLIFKSLHEVARRPDPEYIDSIATFYSGEYWSDKKEEEGQHVIEIFQENGEDFVDEEDGDKSTDGTEDGDNAEDIFIPDGSALAAPSWPWDEEDIYTDLFAPVSFPETAAAVCTQWRDLLSGVSTFWTRLIISVDDNSTPLSTIQSYLTLSGERPLDITISRRPQTFSAADPHEKARIAAAMNLLYPHMTRWRFLHINVIHASSIPFLDRNIHAENMVDLRLESRIADAEPRTLERGDDSFVAPVKSLTIDGATFRDAFLNAPSSLSELNRLTISGYRRTPRDMFTFTAWDLLRCVCRLRKVVELQLLDLNLDASQHDIHHEYFRLPMLEVLTLVGMDVEDLTPLLCSVNGVITLERCTTAPSQICSQHLNLIAQDEVESFLEAWMGCTHSNLSVERCAGFNDALLAQLAAPHADDGSWTSPKIRTLYVEGCPDITSRALRQMVEARWTEHKKRNFVLSNRNFEAVISLARMSVKDCGEIAPEDKAWFDENLKHVVWDSWEGGCNEYDRNVL
ncbi:hypothetical protein B0H21DRAFT_42960 [Amylocystis lapponica]|nr:hypothetical protein B0H21DRAFT_42960 [Amylocystis lapponica]